MYHSKQVGVGFEAEQADAAAGSSSIAMNAYEELFCQSACLKARILAHPLYEQLLAAHVACLRVATPVDQYQIIDATLANSHHIATKVLASAEQQSSFGASTHDKEELNQFMVSYILLLRSFKQQLEELVCTQASEAMSACWEIGQALYSLTGVSVGPGNGSMMPGDEKEMDIENDLFSSNGSECLGLDHFVRNDIENSLRDHVRRELKNELKKDYESKLKNVHEEILRKRRAGKLPGNTTNVLRDWWTAHAQWPYPTEEQKARLMAETGLQLKQINNWFINQRKRNWQAQTANPQTLTSDEGKVAISHPVSVSLSLNADMRDAPKTRFLQEEDSNGDRSHSFDQ